MLCCNLYLFLYLLFRCQQRNARSYHWILHVTFSCVSCGSWKILDKNNLNNGLSRSPLEGKSRYLFYLFGDQIPLLYLLFFFLIRVQNSVLIFDLWPFCLWFMNLWLMIYEPLAYDLWPLAYDLRPLAYDLWTFGLWFLNLWLMIYDLWVLI